MFCRHSCLIVLFYNINLGNAHIIRSSKTADLNDRDFIVRMLYKDRHSFFLNFYCFATFFSTVVLFIFYTASVQLRMSTDINEYEYE